MDVGVVSSISMSEGTGSLKKMSEFSITIQNRQQELDPNLIFPLNTHTHWLVTYGFPLLKKNGLIFNIKII